MQVNLFYDIPIFILLIVAAYTDLNDKKVYNWTTIPAIFLGLAFHALLGGWSGGLNSLCGFGVGFGVLLVLYLMGGMGGGDVKLMGAVGALGGYPFVLWALFYTALTGGLMAALVLIWRGSLWEGLKRSARLLLTLSGSRQDDEDPGDRERREIPYALAIVIGTFIIMLRKFLADQAGALT